MAANCCNSRCSFVLTALLGLFSWAGVFAPQLQAQEPVVHRVEHTGLQPGQKATLTVTGTALKNPVRLWTPVAEFRVREGHDANADTAVIFEGDVPAEAIPGIYAARVITAGGCSESVFVVVDDLPSAPLPAESEATATAPVVPVPSCLTGQLNPVKPRYLRFSAVAGRSISIELFARRLNSELDPVLSITDAAGREVAYCDDVPGMEGDACLQWTAAADGEYTLQIRDVRYTGGARHFFHLRIGEFPLATVYRPRVAVAGQPVELLNSRNESVAPAAVLPAADPAVPSSAAAVQSSVNLTARAADKPGSALVSLMTLGGTAVMEAEPNDTQETATVATGGPAVLSGTLQQPGDIDWFRISADGAVPLTITAHTRDVRSPADVVLQLWSTDGKKLADADDAAPLDAQLTASLPAAGEYLLRVAELSGTGGAEWTYDLEVNRGTGRVEVIVSADRVQVPRGGSAPLTATIKRLQYDGPVLLQAQGLPAALSMAPLWLGSKQSTVPLTFTAVEGTSEDVHAEFGLLQLTASVPEGSPAAAGVVRLAPPPPRKKDGDLFRSLRVRSDVFAAVAPAAQFAFRTEPTVLSIKRGASGTVKVTAVRHADWPMPIDMALAVPADQLPPGVTVPNFKVEGAEGTLTVTAAADAALGKFTVFVKGTAKKDKAEATHPVPPVVVEITE